MHPSLSVLAAALTIAALLAGPGALATSATRWEATASRLVLAATPEVERARQPRFETFPIQVTNSEILAPPWGLVKPTCGGGDPWIRRLIQLENQSDRPRGLVFFALRGYPDDIETVHATAAATLRDPASVSEQRLELLGGPGLAPAGGASEALIDFRPGYYAVLTDDGALFTLLEARFDYMDCASGDLPGPDVNADGMVVIDEELVEMPPAPIGAGTHLWEVANFGRRPYLLHFIRVPASEAPDAVREALTRSGSGAETPAGFVMVGGVSLLSPGKSVWLPLDLPPGAYVAFNPGTSIVVPFVVVAT